VPADGVKAANWRERRLRYVAVFGQLLVKAIYYRSLYNWGYRDQSTMARLVSLIDSFVVQLSQVFMLRVFPVGTTC
jgi:hypothetical protein